MNNALVSQESGDKAVVIQRTQTYIYHEWRGLFGWTSDLRAIIGRSWNKKESTSMRTVPFILIEGGQWPQSDFVIVNMNGLKNPLLLITVYHQLLRRIRSFKLCLVMNFLLICLMKRKFFQRERKSALLAYAV